MITYLYWGAVVFLAMMVLILLGKNNFWRSAIVGALVVFIGGGAAYYFHFEQVFVKRYGGVMTIKVPEGQQHLATTWKDDNLWVENYDPETNICHFAEYSKGNVLQGRVTLKNCNPVGIHSDIKKSKPAATALKDVSDIENSPAH
ncbi:hypothetical protein QWI17_20605 [Gilvimarinus sp. SDUM040013]|uniref:Uncharacterized protein n=1 Tax=Gilvimarinus gilvus TaxID=3058038 RepID=A0ABU4RSE8_9GAMM|nr:hypothetical protein [Gilvimarinus sp. SDUM040013]MDO3388260.1 hypothetical protein [Gilvimarinus sp. SDUM040013]MDX6847810.1 hypothetical protein [Gilvimarinus sp. SDUM040013]